MFGWFHHWFLISNTEGINWTYVERVWKNNAGGAPTLHVRYISGTVDDYLMSSNEAKKISKWFLNWHGVEVLSEM